MTSFGLYVHIPYCIKKCPYCDFNSYGLDKGTAIDEASYTAAVVAELNHYATKREWTGRSLRSVFFGGGTPSLFSTDSIATIVTTAHDLFPPTSEIEITLEANPGSIHEALAVEKLRGFRRGGVNRISMGAQSFSPKKLQFLGRIHAPEDTIQAVTNVRQAGFENINIDLMFGVREEALSEWKRDLTTALTLNTAHLSVYGLTIEPGTAFGRDTAKGKVFTAPDERVAEMFTFTDELLVKNGYLHYEISNYAKPGRHCVHNCGYWEGFDYLGVGAGAHSYAAGASETKDNGASHGMRWSNIPGPVKYIERATAQGDASQLRETLTRDQVKLERLFLRLRCQDGLGVQEYEREFEENPLSAFGNQLRTLSELELIVTDNRSIRLSPKGFLFANTVVETLAEGIRN